MTGNNEHQHPIIHLTVAKTNETRDGSLWARLSPEEQQELIMIEKESHSGDNLIPHSQMINKHKKWL